MSERDEIIEPERRPHWCSMCHGFNDTPASPCYQEPEDDENQPRSDGVPVVGEQQQGEQ